MHVRAHIHILELRVAVWAIHRVVDKSPNGRIFHAYCDNTTAVALLRRLRGSCWTSHKIIEPLAELIYKKRSVLLVTWICTDRMLADQWTRLKHLRNGTVQEGMPPGAVAARGVWNTVHEVRVESLENETSTTTT